MSTAVQKLTFEEFQLRYKDADREFEFWYGEAIPKAMPTLIHGFLQRIIMTLLYEAGLWPASDVELRFEKGAHPRPDIVAFKDPPDMELYPTQAFEVAVEIISEDDAYNYLREKCRKYQEWGILDIYLVNPSDRSVLRWKDGSEIMCSHLAGVPVERIWNELDSSFKGKKGGS